jgi:hypothetical protein
MKKFIGILLLVCVLFVACDAGNEKPIIDNGDNNENTQKSKLVIIDIANATNLFITSGSNSEPSKLFKITDDAHVQEVLYFDEDGKIITSIQSPSSVYNVNDNYVIIIFSDNAFLIRKTNGAVFTLPSDCIPADNLQAGNNFKNAKKFQTDNDDNIYYQAGNSELPGIVKLNISNPNSIVKTDCLPSGVGTDAFAVSPEGHIVYQSSTPSVYTIKKSNGDSYNIEGMERRYQFYIGLDGKIKVIKLQTIDIYTIDSEFNVSVNTIRPDGTIPDETYNPSVVFINNNSYLLYFHNKIFVATSSNGTGVFEFESDTPDEIILDGKNTKIAKKSNSCIYASGNDYWTNEPLLIKIDLTKIDSLTLKYEYQCLFSNQYDIYHFTVSDDDIIYFVGKQISDEAKVIGRISSTGEVNILSTEFETDDIILERIR